MGPPDQGGDEPTSLLLTGCFCCGTTVVAKVLNGHARIILASQPFGVLYLMAKEAFLSGRGLERRCSLDHLFGEDGYRPADFHAFLDEHTFPPEAVDDLLARLAAYDRGLWTPEVLGCREAIRAGRFLGLLRDLNRCLARLFPKPDLAYLGGKEVLCEEYLPYLVDRGTKGLIVLRDPRDMITSLNFREQDNFAGDNRPLLFSLRLWRKSAALALALESHRDCLWLRYEDFARDPAGQLSTVLDFLRLESFTGEAVADSISDQHGRPWAGNSSFGEMGGISAASVGMFRKKLPDKVIAYIETLCFPEMLAFGYTFTRIDRFDPDVVAGFHDPFPDLNATFPPDYSCNPDRVAREIQRYTLLTGDNTPDPATSQSWFLGEYPYRRLRTAVADHLAAG